MLRLRPFKPCDAQCVAQWCKDKDVYNKWGGMLIGEFPLSADDINKVYFEKNGHCEEPDNFYPMVAFDESGVVGHFIMRYIHGDNRVLRFGWVIVDNTKRGKRIGQNMLSLGLKYAFEILGVAEVTIGVFENNIPARKCYTSIGFHESPNIPAHMSEVDGEQWNTLELIITKEEYMHR